ncbi:hypothetical protein EMIT074MI3_10489 [Bacillus licheniformis]
MSPMMLFTRIVSMKVNHLENIWANAQTIELKIKHDMKR